jgi:hypothetical protein
MESLDRATLDLTEMGSATLPIDRAIEAVTVALDACFQCRIVLIPYGDRSVIVYASGPDADELMSLL